MAVTQGPTRIVIDAVMRRYHADLFAGVPFQSSEHTLDLLVDWWNAGAVIKLEHECHAAKKSS